MRELLEYVARELVDDPGAVRVEEIPDERGVVLRLHVAPDDMGKVIGRGGRTARAIRTVVKAAGLRAGIHHTFVDIADEDDDVGVGHVQREAEDVGTQVEHVEEAAEASPDEA